MALHQSVASTRAGGRGVSVDMQQVLQRMRYQRGEFQRRNQNSESETARVRAVDRGG